MLVRQFPTLEKNYLKERFLLDSRPFNSTFRWWVPLTYSSKSYPDLVRCEWIPEHLDQVEISLEANESHWVIFNVDQVGKSTCQ